MAKSKRSQIIMRYGLVTLGILVLAILIVYKALGTTVIYADAWNAKADSLLTRVYYVQPVRGDILADDGTVLATNLLMYNVCMDYRTSVPKVKQFIAALDSLSDTLALYYPTRTADEWREYLAQPLTVKSDERKQCHVLLKEVNYADYERMLKFPFFRNFRKRYQHGLYATPKEKRVRPYGQMAYRSIGRCSYLQEPKFEGAEKRRDFTDALHGFSGLEYALDKQLYGTPGRAKVVQLTHGVSNWVDAPAIDGYSVRTTIDINMQDIVENELMDMLVKTRADWGTCLLMEVATGNIKAISNLERTASGDYTEAINHAVMPYEPGSVMKPISMIVALEDGFAFPLERTMAIGSSYAYAGGSPIHDTHSPAYLPVSRFIEYSSNIGMTKLIAPHYENSDLNGFRTRLAELGFFDKFNTGMAGEQVPIFPTLYPKAGGRVSLSRMAYGYSTMIPPLYTCAVYNAIANDGKFVRPRMVQQYIHRDGVVEDIPVSYVRDSILSRKNAALLRQMLHGVVWGEGGTAKSLKSDDVTIAGKTGTCRIADETIKDKDGNVIHKGGGYKEGQYRLAFCGFFPYEKPKYTCMVLISHPAPEYRGAATTSGFVLKGIALKMFARGMLDNHSDYTAGTNHGGQPTLYACNGDTQHGIQQAIGAQRVQKFRSGEATTAGTVPNVMGMGVRQAVACVEDLGYNIDIKGSGYVVNQTPPAGSQLAPGQTVTLTLQTR